MKTIFKITTATFILLFIFSCSSNDDEKVAINDIDPTNYIIAGKMLNNHVALVTFSSNDKATIKTTDLNIEADYTVDGDTVKIENYGYVKIQNNAITSFENEELDFDQAHLLQKTPDNVLKDKYFMGPINVLSGAGFEQIFHIRFSASGELYGYGETFSSAAPNKEFELISNVAGKYQQDGFGNVFYKLNDKLICEVRTNQFGNPIYFYSEELVHQP